MVIARETESRSRATYLRPDVERISRSTNSEYSFVSGMRDPSDHRVQTCGGRRYTPCAVSMSRRGNRSILPAMRYRARFQPHGWLSDGKRSGTAVAGINSYCLARHQRQPEHLRPSDILDNALAWQSHHPRRDAPLELFHASRRLLSCSKLTSSRINGTLRHAMRCPEWDSRRRLRTSSSRVPPVGIHPP